MRVSCVYVTCAEIPDVELPEIIAASANGLMIKTLAETSVANERFRKRPRRVRSIITMQFMNMSSLYAPHYVKDLGRKWINPFAKAAAGEAAVKVGRCATVIVF